MFRTDDAAPPPATASRIQVDVARTTHGVPHVRANDFRIPLHGGNGNQEGTYGSLTMRSGLTSSGYVGAHWGQSYIQTVTFDEQGSVAQGMLAYSQSTDPASPWYADQTQVYSRKEWPALPFTQERIRADPNYTSITLRE